MSLQDIVNGTSPILSSAPENDLIRNTMRKAAKLLMYYKNPVCAISGGSDSDVMLDLMERIRCDTPVRYVFYDTGIEYQATKGHLVYLEQQYGVEIQSRSAVKPVPAGCAAYGLPFLSKRASEYISRLQEHGFQWEDEPLDVLLKRYDGCKAALRWWCNDFRKKDGTTGSINISAFSGLKEFMIRHPPEFRISSKCCDGAKKKSAKIVLREMNCGLNIVGERRAEGGIRATANTSCFNVTHKNGVPKYMPLFFWSDCDKKQYIDHYGLRRSDCYEVWGMRRTGCAGCPFGSRFEDELKLIHRYEPKLEIAINNIFGKSYEYTRAYRVFKEKMKKFGMDQMTFDEIAGCAESEWGPYGSKKGTPHK